MNLNKLINPRQEQAANFLSFENFSTLSYIPLA